jgi:lipopolysaccharide transport system ATP-binding protein
MSDDRVISIDGVSKAFPIYGKPSDMLKELLLGTIRHDLFWALTDISLEVREGQRVGIIGPNGAGKSTLLQIVSGNLTPTSGSVAVQGKVSALLSLTPTWNVEETGLENIRFNLLLKECPARQIPALTEEIVDFTELGQFIYQPVKTYSAGMSARLAFAIATAISPEILIIDEVLGAGDGYFASKAARRIKAMCDRGRALLLVSHSIATIKSMCETAVWLENGTIRLQGAADYVAAQYEEDTIRQDEAKLREGNIARMRKTSHLPTPDEIGLADVTRFRIRAPDGHAAQTYYVRAIEVRWPGSTVPVPLDFADPRQESVPAALELTGCEWGRTYSRKGHACRMLTPRTGGRKGGHVLLRRPPDFQQAPWPLELRVEFTSDAGAAPQIDVLDVTSGTWQSVEQENSSDLPDGWRRGVYKAVVPNATQKEIGVTLSRLRHALQKPVELVDMRLIVDGRSTLSVREMQPFKLQFRTRHNEAVESVSVNLNIVRSDGVYTFYQPGGWFGENIRNFVGEALTEFNFDQNVFGAGLYEVNVFACNGWSWQNIPPSEIFDRSIGVFKFNVTLGDQLEFGVINTRVPVRIELIHAKDNSGSPTTTVPAQARAH